MGAIMLAGLGAAPQRGAASSTVVTAAVGATADQLVRTFSVDLCRRHRLSAHRHRRADHDGGAGRCASTVFTTPSGCEVSPPRAE